MDTQLHTPQHAQRSGADLRTRLLAGLPVTERQIPFAGISTAILEGGDGPPCILLHGPGESAFWWMQVIPHLAVTHRVIVPDLPGHGASTLTDGSLDADQVLAWLGELIGQMCASPPALVGHVIGGSIAARFAVGHSSQLSHLVLVDSLGLGLFLPAPRFAFELMRFMIRPSEHTYNRFLPQCMYDVEALRERLGDKWEPFIAYNLDRARDPHAKAALRGLMSQVGVPRIAPEDLAKITVPTNLIWGRHDRVNRLSIAQDASKRYDWPLHVIENAADDPKLEQPTAFLQALHAALGTAASHRNGARKDEMPPANRKRLEVPQ